MRKLTALALTAAAAATMFSTPAEAVEVCDPVIPRGICIYALDPRESCGGGYGQVLRVDNPLDGTVLLICALH